MIIGLAGYARVGKDLAAEALIEIGFTRVAFADKLREALYALNPVCVDMQLNMANVKHVVDTYGWDGYKSSPYGKHMREYLQRLGTEVGRDILGPNIWVDAALNGLDPTRNYAVADTRFPNEAQAIKDRGGEVWRIYREGVGPANLHASETALDDWDFDRHIFNVGTREEFKALVKEQVNES